MKGRNVERVILGASFASAAIATAALAASLLGCSAAPRRGETLMESVRTYHEGIRWQRYTAAAGRLPPAERSAFLDEWDERSVDLKITDYEIVDMAAQGSSARVQVKFSWYGDREGTLHDTHARQTWNRRGKVWLLTDEVRLRGEPMPGLAEPSPGEPDAGAAKKNAEPADSAAADVTPGPSASAK
jgi:hypothetical protein